MMDPVKIIQTNTSDSSVKNNAEDVDETSYPLKNFLYSVSSGQVDALDILYSPDKYPDTHKFWKHLQSNREKLLSKKTNSFLSYCLAQSDKYNNKIGRFQTVHEVLKIMRSHHILKDDILGDELLGVWFHKHGNELLGIKDV